MITIGIIGYGTIGQQLVDLIANQKAGNTTIQSILVRNEAKVNDLQNKQEIFQNNIEITDEPDHFFNQSFDVIVEAAGHGAVQQYSRQALMSGSHFIVVSVGAFSDENFLNEVKATAKKSGKQIIIPSAAIGGLDRVTAGAVGPIDEVKLITRKPPKAWYGTAAEKQVNLETIKEPHCIFTGSARESARLFPENVNVSAALSLAGVGFKRTNVEVYVDPTITQNFHEISIKGLFWEASFRIQNTPSEDNPKTGYIVAMSIAKVLKSYTSDFVIGV